MKSTKFVKGVSILLFSSIVAKILGAVFRIPLTWVLGIDGLGLYQLIYPVFALLIVLSSSGMPTAISKMVASRVSNKDYLGAKQVLKVAICFFGSVSLLFSIGVFFLSEQIASYQGNVLSIWGYRAIAPAIFVVSFLSCLRGFFQGWANMVPTALSFILEQGGKLVFGLLLAKILLPYGVEYATSGALLGVTVSEVIAVIVLWVIYLKKNKHAFPLGKLAPNKVVLRELVVVACPIVLSSIMLPLLAFVDSFLVVNLLQNAFPVDVSTQMWGVCSGVVTSLINMPLALTMSIAVSIVPALVSGNETERQNLLTSGFDLILLITLPIMVAFMMLSNEILSTLYGDSFTTSSLSSIATNMLLYCAPLVVLGSWFQTQISSLQALNKGKGVLLSLLFAGGIKILLTILLVRLPALNIWGFVIANFVFYIVTVSINSLILRRNWAVSTLLSKQWRNLAALIMLVLIVGNIKLMPINYVYKVIFSVVLGGGGYLFSLWVFGFDFMFLLFLKYAKHRKGNEIESLK